MISTNKIKNMPIIDIKVFFGRRLQEIRKNKNISQEELAFLSNIDRTYISGVERGKRNISIVNINKIAIALKVDIELFFKKD